MAGRFARQGIPPMIHRLKTLPQYWDAVERGEKMFEVRRNDRAYQKGDAVELVRLDDRFQRFPDETKILRFRIGYVLQGGQFGIEPGYCVLQLERMV